MKFNVYTWGILMVGAGLALAMAPPRVQPRSAFPSQEHLGRLRSDREAEPMDAQQKDRVQRAITAIKNGPPGSVTFRDSTGNIDTLASTEIAKVLQKQLDDGRIKVDSAMAAHDYAVTTLDGKTTTAGDKMRIHPDVLSGADSVFLQEVLVHEFKHKTQANSSEAADECEAYSLELSYKDSLAVDTTSTHYGEAKSNLKDYQDELDAAAAPKVRKRSGAFFIQGWIYQVVLADTASGELGYLHARPAGFPDWGPPQYLMGGMLNPSDLLVGDSYGELPPGWLYACGRTLWGSGVVMALQVSGGMVQLEQPIIDIPLTDFHCMSRSPVTPGTVDVLDKHNSNVVRLADTNGDMLVDTFIGQYFQFPPSLAALKMDWAQHPAFGPVLLLGARDKLHSHIESLDEQFMMVIDQNHDGWGDFMQPTMAWQFVDLVPVIQEPYPVPGESTTLVFATWMHLIQVWKTDAEGVPLELLGTTSMPYVETSVPLSRPLNNGEYIRPLDLNTDVWQGRAVLIGEEMGTLPAPQNLVIMVTMTIDQTLVQLTWDPVPEAASYRVEMADLHSPSGWNWLPVGVVGLPGFVHTLPSDPPQGSRVLYRVIAEQP